MEDREMIDRLGALCGWHRDPEPCQVWRDANGNQVARIAWNPLERIEDAWMVMERLIKIGANESVLWGLSWVPWRGKWICWDGTKEIEEMADTAPRAISMAALKAAGVEVS